MTAVTYQSIIDNYINGNITEAKKSFQRLSQKGTLGFYIFSVDERMFTPEEAMKLMIKLSDVHEN